MLKSEFATLEERVRNSNNPIDAYHIYLKVSGLNRPQDLPG